MDSNDIESSILDKTSIQTTAVEKTKNEVEESKPELEQNTESKQKKEENGQQHLITEVDNSKIGNFFSVYFNGSIEEGFFTDHNDVYIKYNIVAGPDWMIASGSELGVTQTARYKLNHDGLREFAWNQPISISYRSYNFFGWPQIVLSVYKFDLFGNNQILGYGCIHLPVTPLNERLAVQIYSPQSSSVTRQIVSWITGKKPQLVDSNLFVRGDLRNSLHMVYIGKIELSMFLTTKDVQKNGYLAQCS